MRKTTRYTLLAAATIVGIAGMATAQAEVTLYGRAHLSLDYLDTGPDGAMNVSSNSSRLGVKGSHELDYGLKGIFQIEQQINFDTQGDQLASRDTFAGLQGGFGTVRVGKFDTPFKALRSRIDLFGDQVGDARNITRGVNRTWDERFANTVHYLSPSLGGVFGELAYSSNRSGSSTADNDDDAFSAAAGYRKGAVYAAVAYERQNSVADDLSAVRAAASFDLGALRLSAFAQRADFDADRTDNMYGGGVRYGIGNAGLKAQVYALDADATAADALMLAVGVDFKLARNLTVYGNYAMMDNDDDQYLRPYREARSAAPGGGANGDTTSGLSAGMIYNF